jgi:hypothetical protein
MTAARGAPAARRVTAERLTSQLLAGTRAKDPVAVARRLLAVQGQDARGARLAIRSRSSGVSAADVDRALSEERSLLITWLNRGTLHLVASEDYSWLHALTAPRLFTGNARRLAQEGVTADAAERGVAAIVGALAFDPVLLGWCSREALLGSNRQVVTVNGLFRPFALVDGRAVATWTIADGTVRLAPFDELSEEVRRALHADGRRVLRFLAG